MSAKLLGIFTIVVGVAALVYGGFTFAYPDNVANIGPVHVTVQKHSSVLIPPLIGAVVVAGGIVLLVAAPKKA